MCCTRWWTGEWNCLYSENTYLNALLLSGKIQLKWVTESADGTPEDVVPGTGHWSTFGLDGRTQPDNWHYRTAPPPADEAKVRESRGPASPDNH